MRGREDAKGRLRSVLMTPAVPERIRVLSPSWYRAAVDDFKGLVKRIQSGKFRPNKKNRKLWDRFIDYFDLKNINI